MARKKSSRSKPSQPSMVARKKPAPDTASLKIFAAPALPVIILLLLTFIAYVNAWPNVLIFDDREFLGDGRFADLGLGDLAGFFNETLWAASGNTARLYRPLLLIWFAIEARLFGEWAAGYHLMNILLHVLATFLVYGFIHHLLTLRGKPSSYSRQAALLAALCFGIHPIHAEVVNSVFNGSEILVTIGTAGGLWWFLRTVECSPKQAWFGLGLIYLSILLVRESAVTLPALTVAVLWLTSTAPWRLRFRQCLPVLCLVVPLGIYLALRINAIEGAPVTPGLNAAPEMASTVSPAQAGLAPALARIGLVYVPGRIEASINILFDSLKLMVWPHPLQVYYDSPQRGLWAALAGQLILLGLAIVAYRKKQPGPLIGLAFFYISMLPSVRILGEATFAPVLNDRLLYLPSVGLAITLAYVLEFLMTRFDRRKVLAAAVSITFVLTPLTWARNADWSDDLTLLEGDYARLTTKRNILPALVKTNVREGNYRRAIELCEQHKDWVESKIPVVSDCARAYAMAGRTEEAEQALLAIVNQAKPAPWQHFILAKLYVQLGRRSDATAQFEQAIEKERQEFLREYMKAAMLVELYPNNRGRLIEAKTHLEQALQLQPRFAQAKLDLEQVDRKLGLPGTAGNK